MDIWTILLFLAAAYIAVTALIKMMRDRQQELTKQFREEFKREQAIAVEKIATQKKKERELKQAELFEQMMSKKRDQAA